MKTNQKFPAGQISPKHRGSPRRPLPILVALVVLAAISCTDVRGPLEPAGPLNEISDAMHNQGNAHFFFLPPMVSQPSHSGTFDASLSPVVTICAGTAPCDKDDDAHLATYTMTEGHGSEEVRLSTTDEHYHVNWHTNQFELTAPSYRIRVSVAGTLLGFADVQPVSNGKELKNLDTNETIGLVDGRTLPIKFRVEKGAVFVLGSDGGTLQSSDGAVTLEIPAGAIDGDIGITVTPASDDLDDPDVVPGTVHVFGPSPYQFAEDVTLTIRYDPGDLDGFDPSELRIFKVDGDEWIQIAGSSVDAAETTVSAPINSFSRYGVGGPARVHTVIVSPSEATLAVDGTEQLTVELKDVDGNVLTDREIAWESDATAVASVSEHGLVTAHKEGTATITAMSQGKKGTATVRVEQSLTFVSTSAAGRHTCGLTADGQAYCWGHNFAGQLGDGTQQDRLTPTPVSGSHTFRSISAGSNYTCGITTDDRAYCWGNNLRGKLGFVTGVSQLTPAPVSGGLTFASIRTGGNHTCGIATDGQAYCWGINNAGQLGNGSIDDNDHPNPERVVGDLTFASLGSGSGGSHTCGITTGGQTYCWGRGHEGQLGNGQSWGGLEDVRPYPVAVLGDLTFVSVYISNMNTCGLTADGQAYCWGTGSEGQIGDGTTNRRSTPTAVSGNLAFTSIGIGFFHTCGITIDHKAYCWGGARDNHGQLGNGSTDTHLVPFQVSGDFTFAFISAATHNTSAITVDGKAFGWGQNDYGQIGNGSTKNSLEPVAVEGTR
jgi:alpha-tubulin suppressor-like RCC1 family protein